RLGLQHLERRLVVRRREQDLDELGDEHLGQLPIDRAVEADDAPKRGDRIAGERALVRVECGGTYGSPAGVVVLDDHAGRNLELPDQQTCGIEIEQVVERERL